MLKQLKLQIKNQLKQYNTNMKFRSGKYKGVDVETVKRMAPWYIQWVRENRPEM